MKQALCVSMALALAVLSASVPFAAPADRGQSSPDEIICDLVHPWPFNHAHRAPADTDGDGVADKLDRCPGTPRHATVDANGCPMDADGDGVADGLDRCPDTPRGAVVSASGCPKDSDDDGVADGLDRCDDTPRGAVVDARGCPSDADKDGVVDGVDECPDTPMEYAVNKKGCPIPVSETYQEFLDSKSVNVYIQFGSGKADILPASEADLNRVGEVLAGWPEAKVEVGGHTDSQGAEKFNETLSKQRAESVKSWLTSHYSKINSRNLVTKGYGESKPIAPNDTPEGMAQNRRVTFTLLNADELGKEVETRRYKKRGE